MTTIAYRNNILAADTQLTDDHFKYLCHKIELLSDGRILACSGNCDDEQDFKEWLLGERKTLPKKNKTNALLITDGIPVQYAATTRLPIDHPFMAIGSGWKIAMTFMYAGYGAIEAVKATSELEINTNNLVDSYNLKTKKFKLAF